MKHSRKKFEEKTIDALKRCLENVPFVQGVTALSEQELVGDMRPGLVAKVKLPDGENGSSSNSRLWGNPE